MCVSVWYFGRHTNCSLSLLFKCLILVIHSKYAMLLISLCFNFRVIDFSEIMLWTNTYQLPICYEFIWY